MGTILKSFAVSKNLLVSVILSSRRSRSSRVIKCFRAVRGRLCRLTSPCKCDDCCGHHTGRKSSHHLQAVQRLLAPSFPDCFLHITRPLSEFHSVIILAKSNWKVNEEWTKSMGSRFDILMFSLYKICGTIESTVSMVPLVLVLLRPRSCHTRPKTFVVPAYLSRKCRCLPGSWHSLQELPG